MFKKLIKSSLLILPLCLHAQTAADYLHGGAQDYIYGKEDSAKAKLTEGIRRFPDDPLIRGVLALIREQQKSPSDKPQPGEDQKQEDKQQSNPSAGADQKKEGQEQKSSAKDGKQESKEGEKAGEKKDEGTESPEQAEKKPSGEIRANPSRPQDQTDAEAEAAAEELAASEGKMTERQAKALLDSLKGEDDKVRLLDPNERKRAGRVLRDW